MDSPYIHYRETRETIYLRRNAGQVIMLNAADDAGFIGVTYINQSARHLSFCKLRNISISLRCIIITPGFLLDHPRNSYDAFQLINREFRLVMRTLGTITLALARISQGREGGGSSI